MSPSAPPPPRPLLSPPQGRRLHDKTVGPRRTNHMIYRVRIRTYRFSNTLAEAKNSKNTLPAHEADGHSVLARLLSVRSPKKLQSRLGRGHLSVAGSYYCYCKRGEHDRETPQQGGGHLPKTLKQNMQYDKTQPTPSVPRPFLRTQPEATNSERRLCRFHFQNAKIAPSTTSPTLLSLDVTYLITVTCTSQKALAQGQTPDQNRTSSPPA